NLTKILSQNVASLQAAQELEIRVRQLRFHSLLYFLDPTSAHQDSIDEDHRQFEAALAEARMSATTAQQRELVRLIDDRYDQYHANLSFGRADPNATKTADDLRRVIESHPVRQIVDPCNQLL